MIGYSYANQLKILKRTNYDSFPTWRGFNLLIMKSYNKNADINAPISLNKKLKIYFWNLKSYFLLRVSEKTKHWYDLQRKSMFIQTRLKFEKI